ncbi:sugar ABC transporter substrate-binding protein [Vibrio sp. 10N.286.49.C2]|uniref:extracellular solute-binding protein n=1 Tax=unclassified Vibrio TaxID=2614977 RepID=UPI000C84F29D|nr:MULTISPECIES: extracellular solute-binding protein [unclassified Vibrio]PMH42766.1 sugar ABC transporter substrate-binding protein [Vibrio sp. 10N.286.49.C2]PMH53896.1 sugar ABC transporter substrate-binding protein [Vibrio sp. 10N.286.49.B1]PMH79489.1 sugar ABC transporter substrate-binding protein [Vibrio sp. 10N.286.48.B7]
MNKLSKRAISLSIGAILSTSVLAEPVEITVASFPNFNQVAEAAIPLFEKENPDIKVKLVVLAYGDHHNLMTTALATGANLPDVMGIENAYVGRFVESGGLEDLNAPDYNAGAFSQNLVPYSVAQGTNSKGVLSGIPTDIGPGATFYRQDILDKAGVTGTDLLTSWDSFIDAGVKIKKETGSYLLSNAVDIKDIYIRSNLKPNEGIYFDQDHKVLVNSDRFKEAFRLAKKAREAGVDAELSAWSNEWTESLRRGNIAVQMMGAWLGGHLEDYIAPETKGAWRTGGLPNHALASWGGSFYSIPKKAKHKTEAWRFIEFMATSPEAQLIGFKEINAFPALVTTHQDAFFDEKLAFLGDQQARHVWRETAERIPAVGVDRYDPVARQVVDDALEKVLEHDADIDEVLAAAEKQIQRRARRR